MSLRFAFCAALVSASLGGEAVRTAAAADCAAAAASVAAQTGGQVLAVSSRDQNGQTVCAVTILVPARDGGRPRRQTVVVPQ